MRQGSSYYWYIPDGTGSVRLIVDSSGASVGTYSNDEFGRQTSLTGSVDRPHTYTGSLGVRNEVGSDSQLLYARQRWYDPQLGRWLSRDPIGFEGGWNLYNYVNNNPLTLTDASGLIEDSVSQEVLAAVADGNIEEVVFILDAEGPAVGSQSWTLLRNYRAASGWLYKKLGQKAAGDCYQVSLRVLDQLKGFGIQGKILRIQASGNYMYWRGVQIADNGFHQAVVVGNMVYDKLTGGGGMRYDLYMQLIREGSAGAQVVPFP